MYVKCCYHYRQLTKDIISLACACILKSLWALSALFCWASFRSTAPDREMSSALRNRATATKRMAKNMASLTEGKNDIDTCIDSNHRFDNRLVRLFYWTSVSIDYVVQQLAVIPRNCKCHFQRTFTVGPNPILII